MWLLGAGASASAGIPTAGDMVWEFKQLLYTSQRKASLQSVADLSNSVVRTRLQAHIDSSGNLPRNGAVEEYAALFEAAFQAEADRRTYLDAKMAGAKPSYGHLALATLMRANLTRLVWMTNFDSLVADACANVFGATGPLTTISLETADSAAPLIGNERWPIEVKLHGDFRFRRLKNTSDELRHQDAHLRQALISSCERFGLIVAGYSGRDDSVMDTLEDALQAPSAFPSGLFWLHRGEDQPLPRVHQLLVRAASGNIEAALVHVVNFDETLRDLIRLFPTIDTTTLDAFTMERQRWSAAPRPSGRRGWPVVRLNALPILEAPNVCRRVVCQIGNLMEVRQAVELAGVNVLVARVKAGVLAYGSDADVRAVFNRHGITDFDLHAIEARRLQNESGERGLLRDALGRALERHRGVEVIRRRKSDLLAPIDPQDRVWAPLQRLAGPLSGTVKGHPELGWREGIATRIDWADDRLWFLIDPCTVFVGRDHKNKAAAADFARERTVRRYNRQLNNLIAFWVAYLVGDGSELRALGIADGVDAVFRLSSETGFSHRVQP